ncbi:MAG: 2-succinyl-5-enolpyruvyl-6-hydroxy-3-cyclohexene-1-carboxylic-acid synthase [Chloroflexi bacterium]|nr:2-succinyl-5-enolpyruvyl-6-hydroxy-3-cyclohexene-1-carboxylic-acid synthase [Chloroflexota bacterium]
MNLANRNTIWSGIFVNELKKLGLDSVCIAPGSRSTPLAVAFAESGIKAYVHSDERSASYFALGLARANRKPIALVCTSGTATANFFPAIIEANYSEVPLLVLTADRPAEIRESGANQTIDQLKLFGDHVLWFVDVPAPEANFSQHLFRYLQTLAARAYETSQSPLPGAVHLNFQFRKPLEPIDVPEDRPVWMSDALLSALATDPAKVTFSRPQIAPSTEQTDFLTRIISSSPRGLIVCGPRCPDGDFPVQLTNLATRLGYPILADSLSGLRFGEHVNENIIGGYDTFLPTALRPQLILRFGDVPTSNALCDYLDSLNIVPQIHISEIKRWRDDRFRVTHSMWCDPLLMCEELLRPLNPRTDPAWLPAWVKLEDKVWDEVNTFRTNPDFEGGILSDALSQLPANNGLFIANSLPIRHFDQFARPSQKPVQVFANRGASGIDGTLSSALGAAVHLPGLVFVTGDLSFYHDMNGLLAIQRCGIRATIIVINNDGGGIFERLPISKFEPPFTELFTAPHGLTFEHAAKLYGIDYVRAERLSLAPALKSALASERSTIIEIPSNAKKFESLRKELNQRVRTATFMSLTPPAPDINVGLPTRAATFMSPPKDVYYRRNLPHLHPEGHPFFITFRLADSLPLEILADLKHQLERELSAIKDNPDTEHDKIKKKHFARYDDWLDRCEFGPRWLENDSIARIVIEKIHSLNQARYNLIGYCIMPNHVHLLIESLIRGNANHNGKSAKYPITETLRLLKGGTARACNLVLEREGHFWQQESYDRYIRDEQEFTRIIKYVLNNPVKAGLVKEWKDWQYSYLNPKFGEW